MTDIQPALEATTNVAPDFLYIEYARRLATRGSVIYVQPGPVLKRVYRQAGAVVARRGVAKLIGAHVARKIGVPFVLGATTRPYRTKPEERARGVLMKFVVPTGLPVELTYRVNRITSL